jgi:hypothetical protein
VHSNLQYLSGLIKVGEAESETAETVCYPRVEQLRVKQLSMGLLRLVH